MKCIVLANGKYGNLEEYHDLISQADIILCADGGANRAYQLGVVPRCIVGDMDSITPQVRNYFQDCQVEVKKYPRRKDFTDTQLVLAAAEELGADEIIFLGSLGNRLDHTLANLYCGLDAARKGIKIRHFTPDCTIYLVATQLILKGSIGQTVSVLALTDKVSGLYERGFEYPLENVILEKANPYAVSNLLAAETATISVADGILAVFHYHKSID